MLCWRDAQETLGRVREGLWRVSDLDLLSRGRENILDQRNGVGETKGRGGVSRVQGWREAQHTCDAGVMKQ